MKRPVRTDAMKRPAAIDGTAGIPIEFEGIYGLPKIEPIFDHGASNQIRGYRDLPLPRGDRDLDHHRGDLGLGDEQLIGRDGGDFALCLIIMNTCTDRAEAVSRMGHLLC